ncbi:MAG: hypothetical protein VX796_16585 [Pseudomonadota bacterium]|nr:hypothetical protein [Pseudomonadota bacterium]
MTPFEFAAIAAAGGSIASGVIGYVIGRGRPLIETQLITVREGRAFRQGGVLFDPATTREERLQMLDAIRDRVASGAVPFTAPQPVMETRSFDESETALRSDDESRKAVYEEAVKSGWMHRGDGSSPSQSSRGHQ